jgi:hypothetical protein
MRFNRGEIRETKQQIRDQIEAGRTNSETPADVRRRESGDWNLPFGICFGPLFSGFFLAIARSSGSMT